MANPNVELVDELDSDVRRCFDHLDNEPRFAAALFVHVYEFAEAGSVAHEYQDEGVACEKFRDRVFDDDCGLVAFWCCGETRHQAIDRVRVLVEKLKNDQRVDSIRFYSGSAEVYIATIEEIWKKATAEGLKVFSYRVQGDGPECRGVLAADWADAGVIVDQGTPVRDCRGNTLLDWGVSEIDAYRHEDLLRDWYWGD